MARHVGYDGWAPYVPVAQRRRQALQEAAALRKTSGRTCEPVTIVGSGIAQSFWGQAWCDNLESYSDYANRLPRGRTYVRNGSVIDLRIETGRVWALVSGSRVYTVEIGVQALPAPQWQAIKRACSGQVASLVELLQGRLSDAVMATVTRRGEGLFPLPRQISLSCSCPDSATMCKHVAAVLYGVGARLDSAPELLFQLRHVDPQELTWQAGGVPAVAMADAPGALAGTDLSALFGIDLDEDSVALTAGSAAVRTPRPAPGPAPAMVSPEPAANATVPAAVAAKPKPPALPMKARPPAVKRPPKGKTVTRSELLARGVAAPMISRWIASGVLLRTEQRGVYQTTPQTEAQVREHVARSWLD